MAVGFPLFAQEQQGALGQGDVAVAIAFARADVQEHASGIDVGNLEAQAFAYLAIRSRRGLPLSLPTTTGVTWPTRGGRLFKP